MKCKYCGGSTFGFQITETKTTIVIKKDGELVQELNSDTQLVSEEVKHCFTCNKDITKDDIVTEEVCGLCSAVTTEGLEDGKCASCITLLKEVATLSPEELVRRMLANNQKETKEEVKAEEVKKPAKKKATKKATKKVEEAPVEEVKVEEVKVKEVKEEMPVSVKVDLPPELAVKEEGYTEVPVDEFIEAEFNQQPDIDIDYTIEETDSYSLVDGDVNVTAEEVNAEEDIINNILSTQNSYEGIMDDGDRLL